MSEETIVYKIKLQPVVIVLLGVIALVQCWNAMVAVLMVGAVEWDKTIVVRGAEGLSMGSHNLPIHIRVKE